MKTARRSGFVRAVARRRVLRLLACAPLVGTFAASAGLPDTIDRIKPSIVIVGFWRAIDSPRFSMRGTGFAVGDGRQIVTNAHVIEQRATTGDAGRSTEPDRRLVVQVRDPAGHWQQRSATVAATDPTHDLALLDIDGAPLPALALLDSDRVREGQPAAIIGFPIGGVLGFSPVTHRMTVSSIAAMSLPAANSQQLSPKVIRSLRGGVFNIFQLDGTAYPGNSGGPLFDPDTGAVLGVVNMVFVKSTREAVLSQPSGISYAIPSNHVRDLLRAHGADGHPSR